jgi:hypothetical protein
LFLIEAGIRAALTRVADRGTYSADQDDFGGRTGLLDGDQDRANAGSDGLDVNDDQFGKQAPG